MALGFGDRSDHLYRLEWFFGISLATSVVDIVGQPNYRCVCWFALNQCVSSQWLLV